MPGSGRALEISGWLVAAAVATTYLITRYDVTIQERQPRIQERGPRIQAAALAPAIDVAQRVMEPVVDERYADLMAEVQNAAGADLLAVDGRLEAAEREFPSDYRFTYERATLAVFGRAEHHEAFYHLRKAADKAIGTERAREMLHRMEQDGAAKGRLRKLAVGHHEWSALREALENRDRDRLWRKHESHRPASDHSADSASVPTQPTQPTNASVQARLSAASTLEHGTPCIDALIAHRQVPRDPEAKGRYDRLRELCLRGSAHGEPPVSVSAPRHH